MEAYLSPDSTISDVVWKPIPEFPNYLVNKLGQVKHKRTNTILSSVFSNGYVLVCLSVPGKDKGVKRRQVGRRVHRLVAQTWLPQPSEGQTQVNHIDGNKLNNTLENLEWCTPSENMLHYRKLNPEGPKRVKVVFKKDNEEDLTFNSIKDAAKHFNKALSTIWGGTLSGKWKGYTVERVQECVGPSTTQPTDVEISNGSILPAVT